VIQIRDLYLRINTVPTSARRTIRLLLSILVLPIISAYSSAEELPAAPSDILQWLKDVGADDISILDAKAQAFVTLQPEVRDVNVLNFSTRGTLTTAAVSGGETLPMKVLLR
jgi:hypothetical protein